MSLFNRQNSTVPPELQPYYDGNNSGRGVVAWIVRLVLLAIIIALLVVGGIWLAHRGDDTTKSPAKKANTSQSKSTEKPANSGDSSTSQPSDTTGNDSTSTNSPTPTPTASGTTSTTGTTSTGAQPTSIPNTGPGQTVGIFAIATAGGTVMYQIVLRKKMKQAISN